MGLVLKPSHVPSHVPSQLSYFDQNWSSEIKGSIFSVKNPSTSSDFKEIFGWFWLLFFLLKHIPFGLLLHETTTKIHDLTGLIGI